MPHDASRNLEPSIDSSTSTQRAAPMVVGIGGSAGALHALLALLEAMDGQPRLALVVVLHFAPDQKSEAVEILQRVTPLVVSQVRSRTLLEEGHVYVVAPGMNLITDDGHVQPAEQPAKRPSTVIDLFFRSLAVVHGQNAVGIVLSGTGRDGSLGLAQIKEYGGLTIAQAADDCEHDDMPNAALSTGSVDLVLPAVEIGERLMDLAQSRLPRGTTPQAEAGPEVHAVPDSEQSAEQALHDILTAVRSHTRHDFRNYKRATISRRIERRVQVNRLPNILVYRDFLRASPGEMDALLADLLISVTSFFRDPAAFDALQNEVLTPMLKTISPDAEVRVWTPGCASGEESYSVAILLQECADRLVQPPRIQLFASDINDHALSLARAATQTQRLCNS